MTTSKIEEKQAMSAALVALSIQKLIVAMGMHAENQQRKVDDYSMAYGDNEFNGLANEVLESIILHEEVWEDQRPACQKDVPNV